jgi:DNA-binding response OmpR family regulator
VSFSEAGPQRPEVSPPGEQNALTVRSIYGHILVVDDQQDICDLVREYLTEEGFRVLIANDGAGLRNEMARSKIDLVILDLMLGREDGLELARELRNSRPEIGILMLTGRGETVDRIIGLEMGADDYLPKPFHLRELVARVRSVLRRPARRGKVGRAPPRTLCRLGAGPIEPRAVVALGRGRSPYDRGVRAVGGPGQPRKPSAVARPAA